MNKTEYFPWGKCIFKETVDIIFLTVIMPDEGENTRYSAKKKEKKFFAQFVRRKGVMEGWFWENMVFPSHICHETLQNKNLMCMEQTDRVWKASFKSFLSFNEYQAFSALFDLTEYDNLPHIHSMWTHFLLLIYTNPLCSMVWNLAAYFGFF